MVGPKGSIQAHGILDDCATISLIDGSVASQLGLPGTPLPLRIKATRSCSYTDQEFTLNGVHTVENLNLPVQSVNLKKLKQKLKTNDNSHLIVSRETIEGPENGPMMSKTALGWVIHGNNKHVKNRVDKEYVHLTIKTPEEQESQLEEIHELVNFYFTRELIGVKLCGNKVKSRADERAEK